VSHVTIRKHNHFSEIQPSDWDGLLEKSHTNVPFLRYGYLERWWEYRGGGEWSADTQLSIYSAWQDDQLIGIAPLFYTLNPQGYKVLHLLGSVEISDYLDFIARPGSLKGFILAFLEDIYQDAFIDSLILVNVPQDSTSLPALSAAAQQIDWGVEIKELSHTPTIQLPSDWDTYLASIDKKQRHEIRRKLRRAQESSEKMTWHILTPSDDIEQGYLQFINLMEQDDNKRIFLTDTMRVQMRHIMEWAFSEGILQLSFLKLNDQPAAAYYCFDYQDRILVYNSGFDMTFSAYSPGWVLLGLLIQHAISQGKTHFDFMRGNEAYKYRFGATDSFVMQVNLKRQADR